MIRNLSASYSIDGPEIIKKISFSVESGERIGVGKWLFQKVYVSLLIYVGYFKSAVLVVERSESCCQDILANCR